MKNVNFLTNTNENKLHSLLQLSSMNKIPLLLLSNPGYGKTTQVLEFAEAFDYKVVSIIASQSTPEDMLGFETNDPSKDYLVKKYPRWFINIIENPDTKHLIFLDEITTANTFTQAALFKLIFERGIDDKVLPDNTMIVSAGNYSGNLSDDYQLLSPLINRFCIINLLPSVNVKSVISRTLLKSKDKIKRISKDNFVYNNDLVCNNDAIEAEKIHTIERFLNNVIDDPNMIDFTNTDLAHLSENKSVLYNFVSNRSLSYLARMLKDSIDYGIYEFSVVVGLVGYGSGIKAKVCDEHMLSQYHEKLYNSFVTNIVNFNKNILEKYNVDLQVEYIDTALSKFKDLFNVKKEFSEIEKKNKDDLAMHIVTKIDENKSEELKETLYNLYEALNNKQLYNAIKDNSKYKELKDSYAYIAKNLMDLIYSGTINGLNMVNNTKHNTSKDNLKKYTKEIKDNIKKCVYDSFMNVGKLNKHDLLSKDDALIFKNKYEELINFIDKKISEVLG